MELRNITGDEQTLNGIMFYPYETKTVDDAMDYDATLFTETTQKEVDAEKTKAKKAKKPKEAK